MKTDKDGNEQWAHDFGGIGVDYFGCNVEQTSDGGYVVAGWLNPMGFEIIGVLIKTDADGNMKWFRYYSEHGAHNFEKIFAVEQTTDGGFIMTGQAFSYEDNDTFYGGSMPYWWRDLWVIKADATGAVEWSQTHGGYCCCDVGRDVIQSTDGGYVVVGTTMQLGHPSSAWMIKMDADGSIEWDYKSVTMIRAKSVIETSDGNFVWAGWNWSCKMTPLGNVIWKQVYDSSVCEDINEIIELPGGGFSGVGGTTFIITDSRGALVHSGSFEDCDLYGVTEANLGYGVIVGSTTAMTRLEMMSY